MAYKDNPPRVLTRNEKRGTSKEIESKVFSFLAYSQNSDGAAADKCNVEVEDVIEIMLENNFECCTGCGVWWPNHDLFEDKSGMSYRCNDCLSDE